MDGIESGTNVKGQAGSGSKVRGAMQEVGLVSRWSVCA